MELSTLLRVINESSSLVDQNSIQRSYFHQLVPTLYTNRPIKVLTGIRRSGKSHVLKFLARSAIESGVPKSNILFLNFEHDELKPYLSLKGLREIFQLFSRYANAGTGYLLFLDEIQNVESWPAFVRTQYDTGKANIYITGSNSRLLSSELSSALGGRSLEMFIQPFSLDEVAEYQKIPFKEPRAYAENENRLTKVFEEYLTYGGVPEILDLPLNLRENFSVGLIEKIIVNDILPRFSLDTPDLLRSLMRYFDKASGSILSFRNLVNLTKVAGTTVRTYIDALNQAYLLLRVSKYSFKAKEILTSQPKIYHIDPLFNPRADISQKLETAVFARLVRDYGLSSVHYARNERGVEVDFVVTNGSSSSGRAIQVCWELNDSNMKREISPLMLLQQRSKRYFQSYEIISARNRTENIKNLPSNIKLLDAQKFLLGINQESV